jgi:cellulose synthase/poly-beta-1,6-N-acetylglucosamine synthase-like glycosyltransferase
MSVVSFIFWVLLASVFYSYIGYGLVALLLGKARRLPKQKEPSPIPPVTLVIAAYNEGKILAQKLENTAALQYPTDRLTVLVVDDGSDDNSVAILQQYPGIRLIQHLERRGKIAALNTAMEQVQTPIVVFSDANSLLNPESIAMLVRHFSDEHIGAVAGEKKIAHTSGMGDAEGWYWKYESYMKKLDASLYTVLGATGELFALRTHLFQPISEDVILDDLMLSLQVSLQGYAIAYEPGAYALESPSNTLADEERRKVRIATGAYQSLRKLSMNSMLKKPVLAFQFFSRRWLRWVLCPFAIVLLLVLNIVLAVYSEHAVYDYLLLAQALFYGAALIGWLLIRQNRSFIITTIPFYFLFMNFCMLKGLQHYWWDKQTVLWSKAERQ